jgi:hypothetical protein
MTGKFTGTIDFTGDIKPTPNPKQKSTHNPKQKSTHNPKQQSTSGVTTASARKYDHYNHYTRSSTQLSPGSTFYGKHGTTAVAVTNGNGSQSLQITLPGSATPVTFSQKQSTTSSASKVESFVNAGSVTTYYAPNGDIAKVIITENGQQAIMVKTAN